jgi:hypothetical protein
VIVAIAVVIGCGCCNGCVGLCAVAMAVVVAMAAVGNCDELYEALNSLKILEEIVDRVVNICLAGRARGLCERTGVLLVLTIPRRTNDNCATHMYLLMT